MTPTSNAPLSTSEKSLNPPQLQGRTLTTKERVVKLVSALALTIFTLLMAPIFSRSVRQMYIEFWTGKKIVEIKDRDESDLSMPSPIQKTDQRAVPLEVDVDFETLKEETAQLTFNYTDEVVGRFTDVKCPSETAVKAGDKGFHGNWVRMPDGYSYIATQAPVYLDFGTFWQTAFENNGIIVDLTTPRDRIESYCPSSGVDFFGKCMITHTGTEEIDEHFKLYTYSVTINGQEREVQRLHFDAWKDYNGTGLESLNKLVEIIDGKMESGKTPIVHCRAGIGRTGTLISVLTLRNLQKQGRITDKNVNETVKNVILTGRKCRGPAFVQSKSQFETVKASLTV